MQYREPLPPDCPPPSAQAIKEPLVRYRLLEGTTPTQKDFDSYVKIHGNHLVNSRRTPCEQSGVSVYVSIASARKLMMNKDFNKGNRWESIGELAIPAGAGKLNPVEPNGHQTWWPTLEFDPVQNCEVVL